MFDKRYLWAIAWRSAIATTLFVVVAYLATGFGYQRGAKIGFQNGVSACLSGHPACYRRIPPISTLNRAPLEDVFWLTGEYL